MLTRCRECGNSVSSKAGRCPRCGVSNPAGKLLPHWPWMIVVVVVGFFVMTAVALYVQNKPHQEPYHPTLEELDRPDPAIKALEDL